MSASATTKYQARPRPPNDFQKWVDTIVGTPHPDTPDGPGRDLLDVCKFVGISLPYMRDLIAYKRVPSVDVRRRIAALSGGAVSITSWDE